MLKMISALLMTALFVVVCLGAAQTQSTDPTPTPRPPGLADLTAIAARQTAAARPPAVRPEVRPDVPTNIPSSERGAAVQTEADPKEVGWGAPPGVGWDAPERPNPSPTGLWRFPVFDAAPDPNASPTPFWGLADLTAIAVRQTAVAGGAAGPGDGAPPSPLEQTGAVHTVGEDIPLIDAAATALHQMVHSPADAPRAFSSGCELPPRDRAHAAACEAYKDAYKLKYGNPCRHNEEGAVVCLH